jgi:hypothetical protein
MAFGPFRVPFWSWTGRAGKSQLATIFRGLAQKLARRPPFSLLPTAAPFSLLTAAARLAPFSVAQLAGQRQGLARQRRQGLARQEAAEARPAGGGRGSPRRRQPRRRKGLPAEEARACRGGGKGSPRRRQGLAAEEGAWRGGGRGSVRRRQGLAGRRRQRLTRPEEAGDPPLPGTAPPCNAMQCRLVIVTE